MDYMMVYLNDNIDWEIYEIVCEVFDEKYFQDCKSEYESFRENNILNRILEENTQEHYLKAKKELGLEPDSLGEYKIDLFKSELNNKEKEYNNLLNENESLKDEFEKEKSFNDKVKGSKSWKVMDKFRKIRG